MRGPIGIGSWMRWPWRPFVRYRRSWTARNFDFALPGNKEHTARQNGPKAASKSRDVEARCAAYLIRGAEALRLRGIPAAHCVGLGPDLTYHEERMNISAAVRSRKLRVLHLQAHFLRDHTLISAIGEAQGGLHMLAIDEVMGAAPASISLPAAHSSASI